MGKSKFTPVRSALALAFAAAMVASPAVVGAQTASAATQQHLIVIYKDGGAAAVRAEVAKVGGTVVRELGRINALAVRLPGAAVAHLQGHAKVELVEADVERHILGNAAKPLRARAAAAAVGTEVVPYGITMVQADQLSDVNTGNRKLCIIDSGYDITHEDLAANHVSGVNLSDSGDWNTDEVAHGSHVAGTISAIGGNAVGVVGVNPGGHINLFIAKVFGSTGSADSSVVIDAVGRCADAGANIISMSLGGGAPTRAERRLYSQLASQGVLTIAAAGNEGGDLAPPVISYPAAYDAVMSVAAIDSTMAHASFSNSNADVEIAGPGVAVLSTIPPNVESLGQLVVGATSYDSAPMAGSPRTSASGALYNFGTGEADDPGVAGKVCLIQRGNISFADKVTRCQANGGVAAVVYNNVAGMLFGTLGDAVTTIPSVGTSDTIGAELVTRIGQSATVGVVPDPAIYAEFNGTSMATPHVSGVAALVWSYFPNCSGGQIRQALNASAKHLGLPGQNRQFGNGLVQAKAAHDYLAANGCPN